MQCINLSYSFMRGTYTEISSLSCSIVFSLGGRGTDALMQSVHIRVFVSVSNIVPPEHKLIKFSSSANGLV